MENQFSKLVEERQDELLQLLADLVRFPTVSPPARNTVELQQYISGFLEKEKFETTSWDVFPEDPNVVGIKKGTDGFRYNSLIINGHIDIAEVGDESEWTVPVFELTTKDGFAYGRGTSDMKGAVAATLFAVKLLNELNIELKGDLQIQSVIGEEAGEAGTLSCVEKGYSADFALVVDSSDRQIHGQGGVITGWITIKSKEVFHDAMRMNMLHAGGSVKGASAIEKMMKVIAGLQDLERHWAVTKQYPGFAPGTNTINPAVIEGGRHAAFVADECRLWITVHFYPHETYQSVADEIEEHLNRVAMADPWLRENPLQFRWGGKSMIEERGEIFPALEMNADHFAVQLLAQCHEKIEDNPAFIGMSKSVTDAGWLGEAGIPTVIYGPGKLEEAHSVDEKINIEELLTFTKTLMLFVMNWCNTKK
ncbi:acetylornithine deacetylase [Sporosarcina sp. ANT_H38]|uniref:acetylornithine deacetylase n=1 Tax=Sporosarcina sp. ANT_H38 TaxID=2597358 RepID=UPI0011F34A1C|nr:acetylornithine deacetylase [Sporosarcina sp. ANT_H38]KAA0948879.1 acetylornithine deacetylase [Sporosarcina sp. ANT_H38]